MITKNMELWQSLIGGLSEAQRRWHVAQKAIEIGRGGIEQMHVLTGLSRTTIIRAIGELKHKKHLKNPSGRDRKFGGGRKSIECDDPQILDALEKIMDENTAGDPMNALKWTVKTTRTIADELSKMKHKVSHMTVCRLLQEQDYTLQANQKSKEGKENPDRDAQFKYINETVKQFFDCKAPIISVDSKKREQIGEFKNPGQNWLPKGKAKKVNVYDFPNLAEGIAIPYGTYDVGKNEGMVNVGVTYETSEFAVESINQWWKKIGKKQYPSTKKILICADGGGSNGSRRRGWKVYLQKFASQENLEITVCHYPPGTSKWNKIEHRMFSFISLNWKGKPLESYETMINLIGSTTTRKGLRVRARVDQTKYEKGEKFSDEEMENLSITRHKRFPSWNYTISP